MKTRIFRTAPVVFTIVLSTMLSIQEYCQREFAEIADYCVAQEQTARERIEAGAADPSILSVCRAAFPESYAMQDACVTIKSDQARALRPARPGLGI